MPLAARLISVRASKLRQCLAWRPLSLVMSVSLLFGRPGPASRPAAFQGSVTHVAGLVTHGGGEPWRGENLLDADSKLLDIPRLDEP
jgi:hypothetical protein